MPEKKDVTWPVRRSMKEPGNDPTEDRLVRHYEPCGTRSGRGSLDRGPSRHEDADTEEGVEQDSLFYEKRRIGRGKGRELGRRRLRARVLSRGIGIRAETPDIGESSPGGAKSVKERDPERVSKRH